MPLFVFMLLKLNEKRNIKYTILLTISFILVANFDYYYAYFMFLASILFMVYIFLRERSKSIALIKLLILAFVCALLFILPGIFSILMMFFSHSVEKTIVIKGYVRPFEDLFSQSARPLSYFLPATVHPVFGKFTEQFIGSSLYGISFTEHTLYLGWVPMILAFVAVRRWRRDRKVQGQSPSGTVPSESFYIGFFIFLTILAWLFSQPPWWKIGTIKIFMPSYFMYKILPMFRAYCRFGIVLMLAVAVLAGFGLKFILERFKSYKSRISITVLACGLVLFEFWNWPPYKVIDVSKVPAVYYWLEGQHKDVIIAEYPLDINGPNEMYKFYQTVHEKRMINGTIPGTEANRTAKTLANLSQKQTTAKLKEWGVSYVLVHKDGYVRVGLVEDKQEFEKIPQNTDLKLIKRFSAQECPDKDIMCVSKTGPIDVYEVIANGK
ncbi:MAG: hypothetical protein WC723_03430 [Candidatus Omnitrophota bacterium]